MSKRVKLTETQIAEAVASLDGRQLRGLQFSLKELELRGVVAVRSKPRRVENRIHLDDSDGIADQVSARNGQP